MGHFLVEQCAKEYVEHVLELPREFFILHLRAFEHQLGNTREHFNELHIFALVIVGKLGCVLLVDDRHLRHAVGLSDHCTIYRQMRVIADHLLDILLC